ncbi:MAG: hypothetical protein A2248_04945 [Candidatus Raymondbacteria bacterium RIFOXYA2_FULL_49_16]|uniref:histidine kinase n=1 Tax=Candidatus Raymondbacteria bacterium RIFOXYD12_FULL_49_13 TaxID=1817890 RepID=A0A1F7FGU6_UNCRA|nr:MAG: hypothetical protein A2248_04945 [Candidatus Raymondbacteria bacterium RIFOXYA2_FULL_49_16]OGK05843.1 MAG: hypothetical protein A2519_04120 [Candidatus Raymondbacteria bacterium RIFOXYD12_FULL_49_13]OGP43336.1 MAG: hypothetical protein A2324_02585 [Candidatus Raymondbacteria bacterium RIFOXYB2_FULL_49_35]
MGSDKKQYVIAGAATVVFTAMALLPSVPPAAKAAGAGLFLGVLVYCYKAVKKSHAEFEKTVISFHDLLTESFTTLLREITGPENVQSVLEVLEEQPLLSRRPATLAGYLDHYRSLFNKQKNIFNEKNRQIRFLNERILFSKQQLEAVFDALTDGLCIVDEYMRIFRLNRAYARYANHELKHLLGKNSHEFFPGTKRIHADQHVNKTFQTGEPVSGIKLDSVVGDSKLFFEYGTFPIYKDSRVVYVLEHFRNVTNERKINEQLIRSSNLATIGTMITGIAHEMNNPLSGISGCATNMVQMAKNYGLNDKGIERIKDILDCANRAEVILKDLLDLSRKREIQFVITSVVPIIEKSMQSIHVQGYKSVKKTIEPQPGVSNLINCDPPRIMQVFINVIANATLSVLEKAAVSEAAGASGYAPEIRIEVKREGNYIVAMVIDNGMGIPADKMPYVFDPFFTTRSPGEGTGLGLSICSKIMMEHNGRISAESDADHTVFFLEFPVPARGQG